MNKQQRYQQAHKAAGLCHVCPRKAVVGLYCLLHQRGTGKPPTDWNAINWAETDTVIAHSLNLHRVTVYLQRIKRLGVCWSKDNSH